MTVDTTFTYILVVYMIRMLGISMVMMPVTTAGLNQLSTQLIPHRTAMGSTMRQIAGSIGTAMLVTVMTHGAAAAPSPTSTEAGIHGVNMAFMVAAVLAFCGAILSFFMKKKPTQLHPGTLLLRRVRERRPLHTITRK
ncbi:hypothetical protein [Paludifilum halophilum]|uniref:Major facilitator superfamily (MFS) profile domain-containing protein n=1 Tax=Paludifilum halophilum TaxID=1642702 RepID=A0A235B647_9BACL|nr:hypothetical protein [Paludifilum halophilum]OYD07778.1 hypothetical protein CHM34_09940 [Paludifilum halophilum]